MNYYSIILFLIIIIIFHTYKVIKTNNIYLQYDYFDANASTPVYPKTLISYVKHSYLGNMSSSYSNTSKKLVSDSKNSLNKWTGSLGYHTIFNSGGSEGNNYILRSLSNKLCRDSQIEIPHFILSSYEHKTSITCAEYLDKCGRINVSFIEPNIYGIIEPELLLKLIKPNTKLISIMFVNNELGTKNNIELIGNMIYNEYPNIFFHSDVVQGIGKYKIDMKKNHIDAISFSMHKIYGLQGLGGLIISPRLCKELSGNEQISGTQFNGFRGGTENIAGIISSNQSFIETFSNRKYKNDKLLFMKMLIINKIRSFTYQVPYEIFIGQDDTFLPMHSPYFKNYDKPCFCLLGKNNNKGDPDPNFMTPNTIYISFINVFMKNYDEKLCGIKLKQYLLDNKIIVSIGSACNTESEKPSHILNSIKAPKIIRSGIIRISLMDFNTVKQCNRLCTCIRKGIYNQLNNF